MTKQSTVIGQAGHLQRPWLDKRLLVLALFAYVALLVGCTGGGTLTDADYKTGTGYVQLSFDPRFPSSNLMAGEENAVVVMAHNTGGYSIPGGKLAVTTDDSVLYLGTKDQYTQGSHPKTSTSLITGSNPLFGRSGITPDGETKGFSFNLFTLPLTQESQRRSVTITAYACYPYETLQHAFVCIDFDPYGVKRSGTTSQIKPACTSGDVTMQSGGGPVDVQLVQTRIQQISDTEILPSFYMTVNAPSNLKFFAPGDEQSFCDSRQISSSATLHDVVYLSAALSDQPLACDGITAISGYSSVYQVPLIDGQAKVVCHPTQSIFLGNGGSSGNYMAPLLVNMTYGVVSTVSKTLTVSALGPSS